MAEERAVKIWVSDIVLLTDADDVKIMYPLVFPPGRLSFREHFGDDSNDADPFSGLGLGKAYQNGFTGDEITISSPNWLDSSGW